MKWFRLIGVISLFAFTALACQLFSGGGTPVGTQAPASGGEYPGPYPAIPYPNPTVSAVQQPVAAEGGMLYPDLKDGDTLEWYKAAQTITSGLVTKIMQTHDLNVFITLKDGRTLKTVEPEIDDVIKLITACGDLCKDIVIATE